MPGLAVRFAAGPSSPEEIVAFRQAMSLMLLPPDSQAHVHLCEPGLLVGHVGYPEYPCGSFRLGSALICLEGRIYNKTIAIVDSELKELAAAVVSASIDVRSRLERWICDTDGEYLVLLAVPEQRRVVAFCDPLGRLPVYYYRDDSRLLLARECKFVQGMKPHPAFDPMGWAQYLCFGHPLGERTLFRDVQRAPGGMLLDGRLSNGRMCCDVSSLFTVNLDDRDTSRESPRKHVDELVEVFTEVCRGRGLHPGVATNIVSLSGGQDSRCVAAGLARARVPFVTATSSRLWQAINRDSLPAERLAATLNVPWKLFEVPRATPELMERHVRIQDGLVYVGTAHLLAYHEGMAEAWGHNSTVFTGSGGEMDFYDLRPSGRIPSLEALVEHIVRKYGSTPPSVAEEVVGLKPGDLVAEIRAILQRYPEQDYSNRAAHFFLSECARHFEFQGEDRYRFLLWETAPFYAMPMFRRCVRIPMEYKQDNRLYSLFQARLSPECSRIPDATLGIPPGSRWFPWKVRLHRISHQLPEPMYRFLRRLLRKEPSPYSPPAEAKDYLRAALAHGGPLSAMISPPGVEGILSQGTERSFQQLWTLVILAKVETERRWSVVGS